MLGNEDANISANVILNSLNVSVSNSYYGGIVGTNYGQTKVDTSNNTYMWTSVAGVSSTGSISANSANSIGGIAGCFQDGAIRGCHNSGLIFGVYNGTSYVGGIAGYTGTVSITDSYNTGDIVHYPTKEDQLYKSLIDGNTTVPGSDERWWETYTAE